MIFTAVVKGAGIVEGQWKIEPRYTRVDGTDAPEQIALAANGITPQSGDTVLCVSSRNAFDHEKFRIFDDNEGACPVIVATYEQLLMLTLDFILKGKMTLGTGSKKMVLGDEIKTQIQKIIDQLSQLKNDFSTWTPVPNDGGAALKAKVSAGFVTKTDADLSNILSQNHTLD